MRSLQILCLVVVFSTLLLSQIPNAGFENWDSNGEPTGWYTNNSPGIFITITKSSDAHSGNWAVEGNVASISGLTVGPAVISGDDGAGIPINFRPAALSGFYKFNSVNNDYMQMQAYFFKNGVGMGVGAANLSPVASYTQFTVNINYTDGVVPDTVLVSVFIAGQSGFANLGSQFFVDDLAWSNATDIEEPGNDLPNDFILSQNYPNPFNPITKISWQAPVGSHQTLKVYDMLGNEITTLVDDYREAGRYETDFDATSIPSGVYFYRLKAGFFTEVRKMILLR